MTKGEMIKILASVDDDTDIRVVDVNNQYGYISSVNIIHEEDNDFEPLVAIDYYY